ncbi:MAG: hypothetical protein D6806_03400 [Deltaproteobacteria bacterium]|nr:MAG: hypothetical protein D6806_03400 [Deltaproteobacteria bacterium]
MSLLCLLQAGCSASEPPRCGSDLDCDIGFVCADGICRMPGYEPSAEPDGWDAGQEQQYLDEFISQDEYWWPDDGGTDEWSPTDESTGTDEGGTGWTIYPGTGIGPLGVSAGLSDSSHTLGAVQTALGEAGQPVGQAKYTLSFRNGALWAAGIDSNPVPNQQFDKDDHVIALVAYEALGASTQEGLGPGSSFSEIRAVPRFSNPQRAAVYPPYGGFPGGKMDFFFSLGLFIGYDENDTAAFFTVTRPYPQAPDATIDPAAGTLSFGSRTVQCGDGYNTGSKRDVHRGILGEPDWAYSFTTTVDTQYGPMDVRFYTDSYRILGMEFIGGDDAIFTYIIDRLVVVMLYPPFYGKTASGLGLGSTKAQWEAELGAPVQELSDPNYQGKMFVYQAGSRQFGIVYTNEGQSPDDIASMLVLNYQAP